MQLFASDQNSTIIYAKNASKYHNYKCLECQSLLRLRGGIYRQNHFYHVDPNRSCRQNGKSMEHLQVQIFLKSQFADEDCVLEKRFTEINRIADVVCLSQKLVFEVQCSPISLEEVKSRNRDYESLGFKVIWIFHDKRFNQSRLQAAEQYVQGDLHYFTNMDASGKGMIYDQFRLFEKGRQIYESRAFEVDVGEVVHFSEERLKEKAIPDPLRIKIDKQSFCFKGDLLDYCFSENFSNDFFAEANRILEVGRERSLTWLQKMGWLMEKCVVRPYRIVFRIFLERATF